MVVFSLPGSSVRNFVFPKGLITQRGQSRKLNDTIEFLGERLPVSITCNLVINDENSMDPTNNFYFSRLETGV